MGTRQTTFEGTQPIRERHQIDQRRLADWLAAQIPDFRGPLVVLQFKGGQSNPSYQLTAGGRRWVLRRKPPGALLPSAHAVEREYRVLAALSSVGFPVPRPCALCEDAELLGTPFYVMEHIEGRVLWEPTLPDLSPAERFAIYDSLNETLARLHALQRWAFPTSAGRATTLPARSRAGPGNTWRRRPSRPRGDRRLALEPCAQLRREDLLERDIASEPPVAGAGDPAHAAARQHVTLREQPRIDDGQRGQIGGVDRLGGAPGDPARPVVHGVVGQRAARVAAREVLVELLLLVAGQRATVHADRDEEHGIVAIHAS